MTPEDIKKLPTREIQHVIASDAKPDVWTVLLTKSCSLEQQRDALMMALELIADFSNHPAFRQARETLDSIRQMKEGK